MKTRSKILFLSIWVVLWGIIGIQVPSDTPLDVWEVIALAVAIIVFALLFIIPIWFILSSFNVMGEDSLPRGDFRPSDIPLFQAKKIPYYILDRLGDPEVKQGRGLPTIENSYAVIDNFSFNGDNIRWLGDRSGRGEVILDIDKDGWWYTLTIQADSKAKHLVDALREIAPDNINTARYRRRPNVRSDAVTGFSVTQNLQGIWEKQEGVQLVVTPLWFVAFHEGRVLYEVHINTIEDTRCSKHPTALEDEALLLTFSTTKDERYAYQIYDADFAKRLEDASREILDTTPLRKSKMEN